MIRNDADEQRWSPWRGVTLRDALYHAQSSGATAINHTLLNFQLVADGFRDGEDPAAHLQHFEPAGVGDRTQVNAWHQPVERVDLSSTGGHTVKFPDRRIFPYNFLLCHYPLRSLEQARRKVFSERLERFSSEEKKRGWHDHYDAMTESTLLRDRDGLRTMDDGFAERFLVERLSGVGFGKVLAPWGWRHEVARLMADTGVLGVTQRLVRSIRRAR